ncbi:MAG: quercetin dioxygenase-like cupin family protein [Crocinitomix sp.]|jgi:quercetin dioxygenase-like cupin family protein
MNIANLHTAEKRVSAVKIAHEGKAEIRAIKILKNEILAKHTTTIPAVLVCTSGETIYESEVGEKHVLGTGDYVNIKPNIIHWLKAVEDSQLLLIK